MRLLKAFVLAVGCVALTLGFLAANSWASQNHPVLMGALWVCAFVVVGTWVFWLHGGKS